MTSAARAFVGGALLMLPVAAFLQLLTLLGVAAAWPAMVHVALFGWISGIIFAVNYHTMPVFAARDFPSAWLIWLHLGAWLLGVALHTAGQLFGWTLGMSVGLALELFGALVFVANTLLLFLRGPQRAHRPIAPPIAQQPSVDRIGTQATKGAGMALPLALGLLLAIRLGWVSGAWGLAAEHLATLGWLMLMIVGVAYHVLPRFSGRGTRGPGWAIAQLACHYAALGLIVVAIGVGWGAVFAFGGVLMSVALALFAWTIWPTIAL